MAAARTVAKLGKLSERRSNMQDAILSSKVARRERYGARGSAHGGHESCKGCADDLVDLQVPSDDGYETVS